MIVLERECMNLSFEKIMKIMSPTCFVGTQAWLVHLPCSFLIQLFLQSVVLKKEYRKQNQGINIMKIVDKVVENLTRER